MWRLRNRNTLYPFINGAGTTLLLAFLAVSAVLQVSADSADTRAASEDWQVLLMPPPDDRLAQQFSVAFSERDMGALRLNRSAFVGPLAQH